jgi:hypothetical protein
MAKKRVNLRQGVKRASGTISRLIAYDDVTFEKTGKYTFEFKSTDESNPAPNDPITGAFKDGYFTINKKGFVTGYGVFEDVTLNGERQRFFSYEIRLGGSKLGFSTHATGLYRFFGKDEYIQLFQDAIETGNGQPLADRFDSIFDAYEDFPLSTKIIVGFGSSQPWFA